MLRRTCAFLYRALLRVLPIAGARRGHRSTYEVSNVERERYRGQSMEAVDAAATRLGEEYRGYGVLIGMLGIAAIVLALWPHALTVHGSTPEFLLKVEFAVLASIGLVLLGLGLSDTKGRWIRARLLAEELRYQALRDAIETARSGGELKPLRAMLLAFMDGGASCQIRYHLDKVDLYERIESAAVRASIVALIGAACAAFAEVVGVRRHELLLLTIGVPVLVALLHGILAFLRLPQLINQHEQTAAALIRLKAAALGRDAAADVPSSSLRAAELFYELVRRGDVVWSGIAAQHEVIP